MKNRLNLYFALLAIVLIIMFIIRYSSTHEQEETTRDYLEIKKEGVLRLVTDYTPLNYYLEGDTLIGFDYELAQLISHHSGLEVELYPEVGLLESFEGLDHARYDVVARQIPVTTTGTLKYHFTHPLQLNKQVLVQLDNDSNHLIKNQLDLAGKTLHMAANPTTRERIENLAQEIGDTIYINEDSLYGAEQLIMRVAKGEIPYLVCDRALALKMRKHYPKLDISTDISFNQFQSWALRSNSPQLLDSLNLWLDEIKQSKEFEELTKRYFGD